MICGGKFRELQSCVCVERSRKFGEGLSSSYFASLHPDRNAPDTESSPSVEINWKLCLGSPCVLVHVYGACQLSQDAKAKSCFAWWKSLLGERKVLYEEQVRENEGMIGSIKTQYPREGRDSVKAIGLSEKARSRQEHNESIRIIEGLNEKLGQERN